ncbi:hypothetical protein ACIP5Y_03230 [Nocardia sp. NPDC088792]|uniref:hypothetical protein n=1 Tax=Nocardia sp. NPDC088792 TaxID=3364332 RepID=UPI00382F1396
MAIAALGIASGTSHADPAPLPVIPDLLGGINQGIAQVAPGIHWNAHIEGDSVVVDTDAGSLDTADNQFQVRDNQGNVVAGFPMSYTLGDLEYPIDVAVDGLHAVLTPSKDPAAAHPSGLLHDVANQKAFDDALSAAATQYGIITAIGTLVGTIVGAVGGCALGLLPGMVVGVVFLGLGPIGGCIAGAVAGGAVGGMAGLIITGVVAAVVVGIGFFNRINDPANQ